MKLNLNDIVDQRAYERERGSFRERVIALKRLRRIPLGAIISVVFENRDTIRFQVQEMARAERMLTDDQIQNEINTYNPLIPNRGQLCATLFLELTSKADLQVWLPKLVGIERAVELRIGEGANIAVVPAAVDEQHAAALTREQVTSAVHFIRFELTPEQVKRFATEPVALASSHPSYEAQTVLSDETRAALLDDVQGGVSAD
jgi:hypothetical protein